MQHHCRWAASLILLRWYQIIRLLNWTGLFTLTSCFQTWTELRIISGGSPDPSSRVHVWKKLQWTSHEEGMEIEFWSGPHEVRCTSGILFSSCCCCCVVFYCCSNYNLLKDDFWNQRGFTLFIPVLVVMDVESYDLSVLSFQSTGAL